MAQRNLPASFWDQNHRGSALPPASVQSTPFADFYAAAATDPLHGALHQLAASCAADWHYPSGVAAAGGQHQTAAAPGGHHHHYNYAAAARLQSGAAANYWASRLVKPEWPPAAAAAAAASDYHQVAAAAALQHPHSSGSDFSHHYAAAAHHYSNMAATGTYTTNSYCTCTTLFPSMSSICDTDSHCIDL